MLRLVLFLGMAALAAACGDSSPAPESGATPTFHAAQDPVYLSEWGQFHVTTGALELSERVLPYDLNTPLFTDYAHKLRTVWVPDGSEMGVFEPDAAPQLPVGAVITKTFYYPLAKEALGGSTTKAVLKATDEAGRFSPLLANLDDVLLLETRLLVRRDAGWVALSYVWDADQQDAKLTRIGAIKALSLIDETGGATDFAYVVPNKNQCAGCHAPNASTKLVEPLGFRPRHINKSYVRAKGVEQQLVTLRNAGIIAHKADGDALVLPQNANWLDGDQPLDMRARAYLDINCSHCHNPKGPADTSGLDLTVNAPLGEGFGVCKLPIAAGSGTGGLSHDIVPGDPDNSILVYRMASTKPGAMMPELGRSLAHQEGVGLIREWVAGIEGQCDTAKQSFSR